MNLLKAPLLIASLLALPPVFAANSAISVMQFNLHNIVFVDPGCPLKQSCRAFQETQIMNQGEPSKGIVQYDLIMTQENSTPNQQPRNLLDHGLDSKKYALCGGIEDASLFYNVNRWECSRSVRFDVTPNVGPGAGPRKVLVGVLTPKNAEKDPTVLAVSSHWCVPWGQSTCEGGNTQDAHDKDAKTFSLYLDNMMKQYPNAVLVFGGDLNSMSPPESSHLVKTMQGLGYETANPYDANNKLLPTMGGTPDLIFYKSHSENGAHTLVKDLSYINGMKNLSDHWGAVIATFNYTP